jgi:formate C-acetyltransferase
MKTLTPRGSPVYPEINCAWVERDLDVLAKRKDTPFFVSEETKRILREEVFRTGGAGRSSTASWKPCRRPVDAGRRGVVYHYFRSRTIGHITVAYAKVLTKGMAGIKADIERSLAKLDFHDPDFVRKQQFLESVALSCDAAVMFAGRYAAEARRLAASEADPGRRAELERIAEICDRVPLHPARTFQEALQSFWFTHLVLNLETDGHAMGPGRFDQYLIPVSSRPGQRPPDAGIGPGTAGPDVGQVRRDHPGQRFGRIPDQQLLPGFPEPEHRRPERDGQDATNELSFMCLTALEHCRSPQPGLSAQISSKTPHKFLLRCCELLRQGMGMPAMFNSDTIVLSMVNRGKALADARAGSVNGCVANNCDGTDRMASTGYLNLAKCLELALNDGADRLTGQPLGPRTGDPAAMADFDSVVEAFRRQVEHFVGVKVHYDNIVRSIYARYCAVPSLRP